MFVFSQAVCDVMSQLCGMRIVLLWKRDVITATHQISLTAVVAAVAVDDCEQKKEGLKSNS